MDVTNCDNKSALHVRVRPIVGYLTFVLIAGSLLAAPLYWLLPYIAHGPFASLLDDVPFRRVADRSFMLCALVGLYPLCRRLAFDRRDWGWGVRRSRFLMCFAIGLACGLVSLLILVAIELYLGVLVWDNRRTAVVLVQALFSGLASGVIIAVIEESVFRGAFFAVLRTAHGKAVAIVVTSVVYASVHFLRSTGEYHTIHWYSGFDVLGGAFSNYTDPATVGPFLALVAAGVLLAMIRERAGHIALTVGVHCGWVAVIKFTRKATNLTPDPSLAWLADGYDSVTGYLACIYLLIVLLAIKPLLSAPKS